MNKKEKLKMLQNLDEKTLTKRFLIPLYSEGMGCKNVQYNHGILEFGKDIIYCTEDEYCNPVYTGVQVKATEIKNRNVDTMCRQITEAFGKPFTDLSDGKEKDLDKVVLITSKEFTEKAKESLWSSLKGANPHLQRVVTCIDGNQLINLFDKYLPSAFWEEYDYFSKYFHAMKHEFEAIKDVSVIGQKKQIPLEEIYVSLRLSEKVEHEIPREKEIDRKEWMIEEERHKREQIFDADVAAKKVEKLVIVGAPGSGKTTLLKHLALKSCMENLETQERTIVPILVELRQFSESGKNLREYIDDVIEQYDFPKAEEFIEKDLEEGRCQLLLDGFDELATKKRQYEVAGQIEKFIRRYPKNQFIVTSRITGYNDELKGFQKMEIMEFDDHQIEWFITNWFGKTASDKAESMSRTLKENERMRAIARNPLMITITAVIYEEDRELPQRRVELYSRCMEVLLNKWDVVHNIKNKYEAKAKEKILRKLALESHASGKKTLTKEEVLEKFFEYLPEVRIKKEKAEDFLNEIVKRNALLREISIGVYDFLHLSFQEYLAALELRERKEYNVILEHLYDPWWEEIILLFAGFDRDATELMRKIQEKERTDERFKEDIFYSNLILMGKCIADADYTSVEIRSRITDDIWHLYQTAKFSSLRERAIKVLALIKPDDIIDSLIEELRNYVGSVGRSTSRSGTAFLRISPEGLGIFGESQLREVKPHIFGMIRSGKAIEPLIEALLTGAEADVRLKAVEALGMIGDERAVDLLIEVLLKGAEADVRLKAVEALGMIGDERAVDPLLGVMSIVKKMDTGLKLEGGTVVVEGESPKLRISILDNDFAIGLKATEALGRIGSEKAVDPLIEILDMKRAIHSRNEGQKVLLAIEALGRIGSEKAVDPLIEILSLDMKSSILPVMGERLLWLNTSGITGNEIRPRIIKALGRIGSEKAVDPLIEALHTFKESDVRGNIAFALGRIGSEKAMAPLIEALHTFKESDVRGNIAFALGMIGSEKAVEALMNLLFTEKEREIRWKAAFALGMIGSEKAIEPLIEALHTFEESDVRWNIAFALGMIGSEKAMAPLIEALNTFKESDVRWSAAYALGRIGDEKAIGPLMDTLKDTAEWAGEKVGDKAFDSLEKISRRTKKRITLQSKGVIP